LPVDQAILSEHLSVIQKFKTDEILKSATYSYIASQFLSKKERDNLALSFRVIDKTGDGTITLTEMMQAF
jgi:Ca2+-binding EF-hand superfamily protein